MSTRSSSGPEMRDRYFCTVSGGHRHARVGSPACPQGQGFVAILPVRFTAPTPQPGYPKQIKHLGDHIRTRRLDLGLQQKEAATQLGTTTESVNNWEIGRTRPEIRCYPAIITWLGYNPLPEPTSRGEAVRRARMTRGLSCKALAKLAGVDEASVGQFERGNPRAFTDVAQKIWRLLEL